MGQSAGGLASLTWSNYLADRAAATTKIWTICDSGIFYDASDYVSDEPNYKKKIQNFMKISNV